jgi:hypothetical protein
MGALSDHLYVGALPWPDGWLIFDRYVAVHWHRDIDFDPAVSEDPSPKLQTMLTGRKLMER